MKNVMPIFGFIVIAFVLIISAILLPMAMYSADYEIDNGTATASTETSQMVSGSESMWFYGVAILIFILIIGTILWKFFVR